MIIKDDNSKNNRKNHLPAVLSFLMRVGHFLNEYVSLFYTYNRQQTYVALMN